MTRRTIGIWIRNFTLLLVIAAFAVFFGPQSQQGSRTSIGSVNGEEINPTLFQVLRDFRREDEQRLRDQGIPARTVRDMIDQQVFDEMVRRQLLADEARERGFVVSDAEIRALICRNPAVRREGRCDPELFRAFLLDNFRISDERDYLELARQDLLIQKLHRYVAGPLRVSEAAARSRLEHDQTSLRLRYVAVPRTSEEPVEPGTEDVASLLESDRQRVVAEYERRQAEFQRPEQVRARHILFTGDEAESQAQAARERLEAGEDFAALAGELSQDAATSGRGGDLGFFPRGRVAPALEEAAFGSEPNELLGPIATERGVHLLRIEERREEIRRELADVELELAAELWALDRASAQALDTAQSLIADLAAGASLDEAAERRGLRVGQTSEFPVRSNTVPGLPAMDGLREAALALTPERPTVPRPLEAPEAYYVVVLGERTPPTPEGVEPQVERMRTLLTRDARESVVNQILTASLEEADVRASLDNLYR